MRLDQVILLASANADDEYSSAMSRKLWKSIFRYLKELKLRRHFNGYYDRRISKKCD